MTNKKTIGNPNGRGFIKNSAIPGNYVGRILDGKTIEVPVQAPHCEEGQVTAEFAYWSTLQAEHRGFKLGLTIGLTLPLLTGLIIFQLFFA